MYHDGILLGSTKTGTDDTELDVQQEIYRIVGDANFDYVYVSFSVTAKLLSVEGDQTGAESNQSSQWYYQIHSTIQLPVPTNIVLNEDYTVRFDPVEHVSWYYYRIKMSYNGRERISNSHAIYTFDIGQGQPVSILNEIKYVYSNYGFSDEEVYFIRLFDTM